MSTHPTSEELDDLGDQFYGFANDLAYSAGPRHFAPMNEWPAADRARWAQYIAIATLIGDLADSVASDDEPGETVEGRVATKPIEVINVPIDPTAGQEDG